MTPGAMTLGARVQATPYGIFASQAMWAMLVTGIDRCVQTNAARSVEHAVHTGVEASASELRVDARMCVLLGAPPDDLVPLEKCAAALLSVMCQVCPKAFLVALSTGVAEMLTMIRDRTLEKGDPPNVGCSNASISKVPRRVCEFWRRQPFPGGWERDPIF